MSTRKSVPAVQDLIRTTNASAPNPGQDLKSPTHDLRAQPPQLATLGLSLLPAPPPRRHVTVRHCLLPAPTSKSAICFPVPSKNSRCSLCTASSISSSTGETGSSLFPVAHAFVYQQHHASFQTFEVLGSPPWLASSRVMRSPPGSFTSLLLSFDRSLETLLQEQPHYFNYLFHGALHVGTRKPTAPTIE